MFGTFLAGVAAVLLTALSIYAVVRRRTASNVALLSVALLLAGIEVFDQLSLALYSDFATFRGISSFLETLLPAAFLLLSLLYGRDKPFGTLSKTSLGLAAVLALYPPAMLLLWGGNFYDSQYFQGDRFLSLGNVGYWYYIGVMVAFIIALSNIEATLSEAHGKALYRMKFEAFGIMSLLGVLILFYSQGLLYRTINLNLIPVRSSVFIVGALLIGYSEAFRGNGDKVRVSRHVLYRSITLLVVGVYLIILGLIGEGMRYFDIAFGREITIVFAFVSGVLLLAVLFSERVRRRTVVYIHKHFYANKHDYREEWIKLTSQFSLCATLTDVQESILTVYRKTFGLMGASLYLPSRDDNKYIRASSQDMPAGTVELSVSGELRDYFINRGRVLNLNDGEYQLSELERAIYSEAGAWLIVPLISNGKIEGLAVLRDQLIPEELNYDDFDLMKVMARQAAQAITNLRLSEEIMEMQAMAAVARISSFVIHDLKNLATSLSLVVDNAVEHIGNPDFQKDAIITIKNTLSKMNSLTQRLKSIPERLVLETSFVDIDHLSRETVTELAKLRPDSHIEYTGTPVVCRVDGEEIKKVIVNLVQNGLDAAEERGPVSVSVATYSENGNACIRVADSGCGMTEDFLKNQLFKPFTTTKKKGLGIGLYQCRQIIEAHSGRIEVKSDVSKGSVFTIYLPVAQDKQPER
jgi:putative PEP-CTERM system histidine kinase